jgi:hypothetical protein
MAFSIIATSILIHFTETKLFEKPSRLFLFIKSNKSRTLMILSAVPNYMIKPDHSTPERALES